MSTKEKKGATSRCVPSSRRRKVRKSSLERDRRCARKRKRGGVGEKRRARQSVQDTTFFFFFAVSWNDRIQNVSLFCVVVVLTKALVSSPRRRRRRRSGSFIGILSSYIHHRTVFLQSSKEKVSRSHTHRERAVLKNVSQNKVVLAFVLVVPSASAFAPR